MRYFLNLIFIGFYSFTTAQGYLPVEEASKVSFKIKNFGSSVDGSFKGLKGTIDFNPSDVINAIDDLKDIWRCESTNVKEQILHNVEVLQTNKNNFG